jgi:transketolase C-terminal domain/subunit
MVGLAMGVALAGRHAVLKEFSSFILLAFLRRGARSTWSTITSLQGIVTTSPHFTIRMAATVAGT